MTADITLLTGRAGAGKTRAVYARMAQQLRAGQRPFLIVPDQFTFEAEQDLCRALGGGLLGGGVHSFTTLSRQVLRETGLTKPFLTPIGRRMLLRRVVGEHRQQLRVFGGVCQRPGFAAKLEELFRLCRRSDVDPEALLAAAETFPEGTLARDKLEDLALLYKAVQQAVAGTALEAEDALTLLSQRFAQSSFAGRDVYLDEFSQMTAQLYRATGAIAAASRSLTATICMDPDPDAPDAAVFAPSRRHAQRLRQMAQELGAAVREEFLFRQTQVCPALRHLERNAFAYDAPAFQGEVSGVSLFAASSLAAEVDALALAVQAAAREGVRYRDMAVIASDLARYAMPVRRSFARLGIPLFLDAGRPVAGHPLAVLALCALRFCGGGWPLPAFLDAIKTGFCNITTEQAELLENYILQHGIRGGMLTRPFLRGKDEDRLPAEAAREAAMGPLLRLREGLQGQSFPGKTRALYAYLEDVRARDRLSAQVEELRGLSLYERAQQHAQVYDALLELFEQFLGLTEPDTANDHYIAMFEEGLAACEAGVVPSTADQVTMGSVPRGRSHAVERLFVVGCVQGLLPRQYFDDDIIGDRELSQLEAWGLEVWGGTDQRAQADRFALYSALSRPTRALYLSYPLSLDGQEQEPCTLFEQVRGLLPRVPVGSDIGAGFSLEAFALSPLPVLSRGLRQFLDAGRDAPGLARAYACAGATKRLEPGLGLVRRGLFYDPAGERVSPALAQALCRGFVSASRLETYNACPFRYLAEYGIQAAPRKLYEERPADEGSFYHDGLDMLLRRIQRAGLDFAALTEKDVGALVDELLPALLERHNQGYLTASGRTRAQGKKLARTLKTSAGAMVRQIALGSFRPALSEASFGPNAPLAALPLCEDVSLVGRMDRLDAAIVDGQTYLRVVDYKRGDAGFDFAELYAGLRLQLPLYLRTALAENEALPAGMYYQRVYDPVLGPEQEDADLLAEYRLAGVSLDHAQALAAAGAAEGVRGNPVLPPRLADEEQLQALMDYARAKAAGTVGAIRSGKVPAAPYRYKQKNACTFCEMKSICGFDRTLPACRFRDVFGLTQEEFFARTAREEDQ